MANKESSEAAKKIANAEKEKTSKKPKKNKKNIFKAIARFFKDLKGETKKITWPAAKEVLKGTDTEAIKAQTEALTKKFYEISEKLYQQAQAAQAQ